MNKDDRNLIDENLRQLVGLGRLYDYESVEEPKSNGIRVSGYVTEQGKIRLDAGLRRRSKVAVYLHEVAHVIAEESGLNISPGAGVHNQYFALLVAVMYRRADLFEYLKVYDASDSPTVLSGVKEDAEEVLRRFQYAVRKSAHYAETDWTIEEIARFIHRKDARPHSETGVSPVFLEERELRLRDILVGFIGGCLLSGSVAFAAVTTFML